MLCLEIEFSKFYYGGNCNNQIVGKMDFLLLDFQWNEGYIDIDNTNIYYSYYFLFGRCRVGVLEYSIFLMLYNIRHFLIFSVVLLWDFFYKLEK